MAIRIHSRASITRDLLCAVAIQDQSHPTFSKHVTRVVGVVVDEQEVVEVCRVGPENSLAPRDASLSNVSVKTDTGATVAVDVLCCACFSGVPASCGYGTVKGNS